VQQAALKPQIDSFQFKPKYSDTKQGMFGATGQHLVFLIATLVKCLLRCGGGTNIQLQADNGVSSYQVESTFMFYLNLK
jgi:hypothetical protein